MVPSSAATPTSSAFHGKAGSPRAKRTSLCAGDGTTRRAGSPQGTGEESLEWRSHRATAGGTGLRPRESISTCGDTTARSGSVFITIYFGFYYFILIAPNPSGQEWHIITTHSHSRSNISVYSLWMKWDKVSVITTGNKTDWKIYKNKNIITTISTCIKGSSCLKPQNNSSVLLSNHFCRWYWCAGTSPSRSWPPVIWKEASLCGSSMRGGGP